ncbi:hypothetical protein KD050_18115 [Psychrobacillus sp. INOP01]|uniref:hypothetical protein n=1 Tax=Psychrobacillus sp. INOP01 TaxID=2829187 RepID=UPI001BAA9A99|nr:hypothetical protein [Psychrobacillus sp. INOP01]QUG41179.1 hypothetical protein KD050_18115 [Psychrobacillus sp. INOP01]
MANFRLKELQDITKEAQSVKQYVRTNMHRPKKTNHLVYRLTVTVVTIAMIFIVLNVVKSSLPPTYSSLSENLIEVESLGGATSSEMFRHYDDQADRELTYYRPISLEEYAALSPIKIPETSIQLKQYDSTVIVVESDIGFETQFMFDKRDEYKKITDFLVISVSNSDINPFILNDFTKITEDGVGNSVQMESLSESVYLMHQIRTTPSALVYRYYDYDEATDLISVNVTSANELYTYYKGNIYHIGYDLKQPIDEVVAFVKEFILLNADNF